MLKLLADLRNHPANIFIAQGLPVTLSPDDPSIYGWPYPQITLSDLLLTQGILEYRMISMKLSWLGISP